MFKKTALSAGIIAFAILPLYPQTSLEYTVSIKNFSKKMFQEKTSRFILSSSTPDFSLPDTIQQRVISSETNNGTRIYIETGPNSRSLKSDAPDAKTYLADTPFLNLDSKIISKKALRIKSSHDKLNTAETIVNEIIVKKTIGIPIISAERIINLGTGDCTEHSVLAVALLRSAGVLSRAVVGMLAVPEFMGKKNVFVYHMWVEAWHNGRWTLVDPSWPGEKHCNRYIAFAYHNLKTEMPLSFLKALSEIQDLRAEYLL